VTVSHAYVHLVEIGPVKVGGLWVKPGDLLMARQTRGHQGSPGNRQGCAKAAQMMEDWERKSNQTSANPRIQYGGVERALYGSAGRRGHPNDPADRRGLRAGIYPQEKKAG